MLRYGEFLIFQDGGCPPSWIFKIAILNVLRHKDCQLPIGIHLKMAAVEYVLSHPLCFLLNKFGKVQNKLLKNALLDFYSPEALSAAKRQLLKDFEKVKDVSFPHIPQQRQGENKDSREIDDMFTILTVLDEAENVSVSVLPTYVADNTDNIPSLRIYEGDMGVFVTMLGKLKAKFSLMEAAISNIAQDLHNVHTKVNACQPGNTQVQPPLQRSAWPPLSPTGDVNKSKNKSATCSAVTSEVVQSADLSLPVADQVISGFSNQTSTVVNSTADQGNEMLIQGAEWASLVSTPFVHSNRYEVFASADDEHSDAGPFMEPRSARVKRRRQLSRQQGRQQQSQQQSQEQQVADDDRQRRSSRRSRAPLMVGKAATCLLYTSPSPRDS